MLCVEPTINIMAALPSMDPKSFAVALGGTEANVPPKKPVNADLVNMFADDLFSQLFMPPLSDLELSMSMVLK